MVALTMDPAEREEVLKLIKVKDKIEAEISQCGAVLQKNNVGMSDSLVDQDGYPRNDIDVYQVRLARHRIICLQNDLKNVMKDIESGLHNIHEPLLNGFKEPMDTQVCGNLGSISNQMSHRTIRTNPFVRVNFLSPGSPAERAGLLVDDLITEFGSVNSDNFTSLEQVAQVMNNSVGKNVSVTVIRGGDNIRLTLIPKQWSGRGLLGCNITTLENNMDVDK